MLHKMPLISSVTLSPVPLRKVSYPHGDPSFAPSSTTWCAVSRCHPSRLQRNPTHFGSAELVHGSCSYVQWTALPSVAAEQAPTPPAFTLMKLLPHWQSSTPQPASTASCSFCAVVAIRMGISC